MVSKSETDKDDTVTAPSQSSSSGSQVVGGSCVVDEGSDVSVVRVLVGVLDGVVASEEVDDGCCVVTCLYTLIFEKSILKMLKVHDMKTNHRQKRQVTMLKW